MTIYRLKNQLTENSNTAPGRRPRGPISLLERAVVFQTPPYRILATLASAYPRKLSERSEVCIRNHSLCLNRMLECIRNHSICLGHKRRHLPPTARSVESRWG